MSANVYYITRTWRMVRFAIEKYIKPRIYCGNTATVSVCGFHRNIQKKGCMGCV